MRLVKLNRGPALEADAFDTMVVLEAIEHRRDHGYANQTSQSSGSGGLPGFEGSGVGPVLEELCLAFKGYGGACRRAPVAGGLRGLG